MCILGIEMEGLVIKVSLMIVRMAKLPRVRATWIPAHVPSNLLEPPENSESVSLANIY